MAGACRACARHRSCARSQQWMAAGAAPPAANSAPLASLHSNAAGRGIADAVHSCTAGTACAPPRCLCREGLKVRNPNNDL